MYESHPEGNFLGDRYQLAFLLGTPHYGAGLGEWAIICAKRRNIRCANDAQSQTWSQNVKEFVATTRETQKHLREILKKQDKSRPMIKIVGCFASFPVPGSQLVSVPPRGNSSTINLSKMMSPEWAAMPEFTPIPINNHHLGLTHLNPEDRGMKKIKTTLSSWKAKIQSPDVAEHTIIGEHHEPKAPIQGDRLQIPAGGAHGITPGSESVPSSSTPPITRTGTGDSVKRSASSAPPTSEAEAVFRQHSVLDTQFTMGAEVTDNRHHVSHARSTTKRALLIGSQRDLAATPVDMDSMDEVLQLYGFITRRIGGTVCDATRSNILEGIDALIRETSKGDAVVVYYTGHGMMTERNDEQKTQKAETSDKPDRWRLQFIVPSDFDDDLDSEFKGIADFELSQRLAALSEKTDNITLILDCCHSTRMARASAKAKCLFPGDYPRAWAHTQRMINSGDFQRQLYPVDNPSVVRIVAAQATEFAFEGSIQSTPGSKPVHKSALTEALVEALQHMVSKQIRISWARIMLRVKDRVRATMPFQHPAIEGPSRRFCFETALDDLELGLPVSKDKSGHYILGGGYLHGVTDEDEYAIMPTEATTVQSELQIAKAKVSDLGNKVSTLELTWKGSHSSLPDRGANAILTRRGLPKSPFIIEKTISLFEKLSDAVKTSKRLCIEEDITGWLAWVRQEGPHFTLKDARKHTIRKYRVTDNFDEIAGGIMHILEALDKAKHVLGLGGARPDDWPLQDVSVEFGIVKFHGGPKQPLRVKGGGRVKEHQRTYFEIKNSGKRCVYVSVLDVCLHHVSLCASNIEIPGDRTETIGDSVAGKIKGYRMDWPPNVPTNQSLMATAVVVLTDSKDVDLRILETEDASDGAMRNEKESYSGSEKDDLMSRVYQIVGGNTPVSKNMTSAGDCRFGIWTYEYKLVPEV